jgi:hypothetical protein
MENPFRRRQPSYKEVGVDEDMTLVRRLGLDGMKRQLDRHARPLAERAESLTGNGVTALEAAAGLVAVIGAAGTVIAFRAARG